MVRDWGPIAQALIASLFTWSVTALGAAVVFLIPPYSKKLLDVSLGFAAGVMTAASFWSLLAPAIELAETAMGKYAFVTVGIGFASGSAFVGIADRIMPSAPPVGALLNIFHYFHEVKPSCVLSEMSVVDLLTNTSVKLETDPHHELHKLNHKVRPSQASKESGQNNEGYGSALHIAQQHNHITNNIRRRPIRSRNNEAKSIGNNASTVDIITDSATSDVTTTVTVTDPSGINQATEKERALIAAISWRRILLLIIAVTVHNIPEGLAVGVAFGSIGKAAKATFESAFTLSLGIGLQNFPEGLAVSLPLVGFGHSKLKAFFYGQLSGMVEPIAALFGAMAVILMEPALPYALSFAAGAMIYVVVDDIIPEAQRNGNGKLASMSAIIGFLIMMSLDVGLG